MATGMRKMRAGIRVIKHCSFISFLCSFLSRPSLVPRASPSHHSRSLQLTQSRTRLGMRHNLERLSAKALYTLQLQVSMLGQCLSLTRFLLRLVTLALGCSHVPNPEVVAAHRAGEGYGLDCHHLIAEEVEVEEDKKHGRDIAVACSCPASHSPDHAVELPWEIDR